MPKSSLSEDGLSLILTPPNRDHAFFWPLIYNVEGYSFSDAGNVKPLVIPLSSITEVIQIKNRDFHYVYFKRKRLSHVALSTLPDCLKDRAVLMSHRYWILRDIRERFIGDIPIVLRCFSILVRYLSTSGTLCSLGGLFLVGITLFQMRNWAIHETTLGRLTSLPSCDPACVTRVVTFHLSVALLFFLVVYINVFPSLFYFLRRKATKSRIQLNWMRAETVLLLVIGLICSVKIFSYYNPNFPQNYRKTIARFPLHYSRTIASISASPISDRKSATPLDAGKSRVDGGVIQNSTSKLANGIGVPKTAFGVRRSEPRP